MKREMIYGMPGLTGILLVALLIRLIFFWYTFASNFDTSTVGLMGLHILEDGERPLFFYGQNYMGALEAYVVAFMFKLFGTSSFTLSLAPIFFSLCWITAMYFLFREAVSNKAGMVAALCTAIPDWYSLWYGGIGAYGGYPASFFFGTVCLWLSVRINQKARWIDLILLGACAGLGLWTLYISAAFILAAGLNLFRYFLRARWQAVVVFGVGLLFASPLFFKPENPENTSVHSFIWEVFSLNTNILFTRTLPQFLFAGLEDYFVLKLFVLIVFIGGMLFAFMNMFRLGGVRQYIPLIYFLIIFLSVYLFHVMAVYGATRYVVPFWIMIVSIIWSMILTSKRLIASVLFSFWLLIRMVGIVLRIEEAAPLKQEREAAILRVIQAVEDVNLKSITMVGNAEFGINGQKYTFYAKNKTRFISPHEERHQPSSQLAETEPDYGFLCKTVSAGSLAEAFNALMTDYKRQELGEVTLFYKLKPKPWSGKEIKDIPSHRLIFDRKLISGISGNYGTDHTLVIDLKKIYSVNGFWLQEFGEKDYFGLPRRYTLLGSTNGVGYEVIQKVEDREPMAYIKGPKIYCGGYHAIMESRFKPVGVRYLKFIFYQGPGELKRWHFNECFIFEHDPSTASPNWDKSIDQIIRTLQELSPSQIFADRWVSARILEKDPSLPALPRYNSKYAFTKKSRIPETERPVIIDAQGAREIPSNPDKYWTGHFLSH